MNQEINFGVLEPFIHEKDIIDILVLDYDNIHTTHLWRGEEKPDISFSSRDSLMQTIESILSLTGQSIDAAHPIVEARLEDGTRIEAVIPPVSPNGPVLHMSRPFKDPMTMERLVEIKAISAEAAEFLSACVKARSNIVVFGNYRSGKTTILNVLGQHIPELARIALIQDSQDISLSQKDVISFESRPANRNGEGQVSIRQLLQIAMKMQPHRIVINEVKQSDLVLPLLNEMNIGYSSMFTMDASTAYDVISRLEQMATMSNPAIPLLSIREQISGALNILVQVDLMNDGFRRIASISEVQGLRADSVVIEDLFAYESGEERDAEGRFIGQLKAKGIIPKALSQINAAGGTLSANIFEE